MPLIIEDVVNNLIQFGFVAVICSVHQHTTSMWFSSYVLND